MDSSAKGRAVIWMAWGTKYIKEAALSRESIASTRYPAVLITDEASAGFAEDTGAFDHVIRAEFERAEGTNQRKSELGNWLPDDYDSFLFLDTDTRVLGDISLGFEKAEQHGIAMVPAAHYSLDHFWGFDSVMIAKGVEPRELLQYNSGVIFFTRTPEVKKVFTKWYALISKYGWNNDQSFL